MLLQPFDDPCVGAVGGRQCLALKLTPLRSTRVSSIIRATPPCRSNHVTSLALRRHFFPTALPRTGGRPCWPLADFHGRHLAEDAVIAANMLKAGWKVAYQGDACAIRCAPAHGIRRSSAATSTPASCTSSRPALLAEFGSPRGEGGRFVRSEFRFLARRAPYLLPGRPCARQ